MEFADVSVPVSGLREGLTAVVAGVRPLARVNPHVNVEFVFADEALPAAGAFEGLVARVVALVHLQLRHAPVPAAALGALVAGPHLHVLPAVQPQPAGGAEALAALGAPEGLLAAVDVDVQLEAGGRGEAVAADGAEVRPLPAVDGQVLLQLVLVQEGLAADGAVQRLLPLVRAHVRRQLEERGEGQVAPRARVRPLLLQLPVLEAVLLQLLLLLEGLDAAAALVGSLPRVSPQVVLERRQLQEDAVAVRALGFPPAVDHQVPLVVRQLDEALVAQGAVILLALVELLVLLQRVRHLELLPAGVAREGLQVSPHVSLQRVCAGEGLVTLGAGAVVFLHVDLQVLVEVFREGESLLTVRTRVTLAVRLLLMRHNVPLQVIHPAKYLPTVPAGEALGAAGLDLLVHFEVTRERPLFFELFVAGEAREAFDRVGFLVRSELQPGV